MNQQNYPVESLTDQLALWVSNYSEKFKSDSKDEIFYNGLQSVVKINRSPKEIFGTAELANKQIILYDNFMQFHWGISYSLLTIFDLGIHKPMNDRIFKGEIISNQETIKAKTTFIATFKLLQQNNLEEILTLPNPSHAEYGTNEYVKKANGLFQAGVSFIVYHEFAHHFFGHPTYITSDSISSIKEEIDCDNYAIEISLDNITPENLATSKLGGILAMFSLLYLSNSSSGGLTHPDTITRINNILDQYQLNEEANEWGIASLGLIMWAEYYSIAITINTNYDCYRDMYKHIASQLQY